MTIYTLVQGVVGTNTYVVADDKGNCVVIDPEYSGTSIVGLIEDKKLNLKAILLTHGHYDHIGGIEPVFEHNPNVDIYIGRGELDVVSSTSPLLENPQSSEIVINNAKQLADGDTVVAGDLEFKVMHTPGHSHGGVVYIIDDVIFSGDTLFYEEIGRCDLYSGNYHVMLTTLRKLSDLKGDYTVYPGHGSKTTLDHEREYNRYMQQTLL